MSGTAQRFVEIDRFTITNFPLYVAEVTPNDDADLPGGPGVIRANEAGDVTYIAAGGGAAVTLSLVAGEFIPNIVRRVLDTGTDAIALTVHY